MSDDKTCDDSTISIFSQEGVTTIHREHDVLLTCKDEPKLIGVLDNHGGYCISLVQNKGHLQTRLPSKKALHALQQANSVCITSLPLSKPSQDACCLWLPRQVHMTQSGIGWGLYGLAPVVCPEHPEVLPRSPRKS